VGDKVDGFRAKLKAMPEDSPLRALGVEIGRALHTKAAPGDFFAMADMVMQLEDVKRLIDSASRAANEEFERRKRELYEKMLSEETQSFSRKGKSFYQTTNTFVKAREELGGRTNPELKEWLEDNKLGDIVKQDIHYQTLQGSVNDWIDKNPIEVVRNGDNLDGQELLDALGITQEEYDNLTEQHARLRELCDIGETYTVGMRKA
jgi:hypothetical protein